RNCSSGRGLTLLDGEQAIGVNSSFQGLLSSSFPEKLSISPPVRNVSVPPTPSDGSSGRGIPAPVAMHQPDRQPISPLTSASCRFLFIPQPLRQETLDFRVVSSEQPLHVEHTRPLLLVPGRWRPPVRALLLIQVELQQPNQAYRHPLRLARLLDRVPRPRPGTPPNPDAVSGLGTRPPASRPRCHLPRLAVSQPAGLRASASVTSWRGSTWRNEGLRSLWEGR